MVELRDDLAVVQAKIAQYRELISRGVLDPGSLDRFREIALAALAPHDAFGGRR